jgi:hypothetical protein
MKPKYISGLLASLAILSVGTPGLDKAVMASEKPAKARAHLPFFGFGNFRTAVHRGYWPFRGKNRTQRARLMVGFSSVGS